MGTFVQVFMICPGSHDPHATLIDGGSISGKTNHHHHATMDTVCSLAPCAPTPCAALPYPAELLQAIPGAKHELIYFRSLLLRRQDGQPRASQSCAPGQ